MARATFALLLVLLVGAPGCLLSNLSPEVRLRDQVYGFNDEARWARFDLARQRVAPTYQPRFDNRRVDWGEHIRIAHQDIVGIVFEGDKARSTVEVQWYDERTLLVSETTLHQEWSATDSGFLLSDETIVAGDETLFDLSGEPEDDEAETAGGEADEATASVSATDLSAS